MQPDESKYAPRPRPLSYCMQVNFLLANPGVSVLGSAVAIFSGRALYYRHGGSPLQSDVQQDRVGIPSSAVQRIVRHPTDSAFLWWSLFFSCCVAHPSVVMRRSAVLDAGGYDEAAEPAEDYDLWLRMAERSPGCILNTGEVCAV